MKKSKFLKWGGLVTSIVAVSVFLFATRMRNSNNIIQSLPEFNEQGTKQWSDADKYLPGQKFTINTSQDTVIQTMGGMVIAVPANCFLGDDGKPVNGPVDLETKEALDPTSIMKSGLSTKSGDKLLASAGMFYLNGRKDGKSLKIDPTNGIYVHVPADSIDGNIQAFQGNRMPNGTIDWVNPKPLIHNLLPVDIHSLNFYPPLYLDSLAMWGKNVKNKNYTDSLYYSFASLFGSQGVKDTAQRGSILKLEVGRKLFYANCSACHSLGGDILTGPDLKGVTARVPKPYSEWLLKYIKNNIKVKASGDVYANKLAVKSGGAMTVFDGVLTDNQIMDIIDYINNYVGQESDKKYYPCDTLRHYDYRNADSSYPVCGINPAKIKAIWCDEFQNTNISTREFEARMPYIHKTGDASILDLYVNNLDKNLSAVDSMAAEKLGGDLKTAFLSFASRGDGKVAGKSHLFEKLKAFYERKSKLFTEAVSKAQQKFFDKQTKLDAEAQTKADKKYTTDTNRENHIRGEEYKLNLKEACRQVGDPDSIGRTDKNGYTVLCTKSGWVNLDAYVWESTKNRTTLEYTSPTNGKKAEIKYLPFSVSISNFKQYDNAFVYLLPDKLNSFMRVIDSNGKFEEKLDEIFSYKMECIAYKANQAYYYSMDNVQSKEYSDVDLQPISMKDLDKELAKHGNSKQTGEMEKEVDYLKFEMEDNMRTKKNKEIEYLRERLVRLLFPCYGYAEQQQGEVFMQRGK